MLHQYDHHLSRRDIFLFLKVSEACLCIIRKYVCSICDLTVNYRRLTENIVLSKS